MLGNWIHTTSTTTGTGDLTVSGVTGYPTFNDVFGTGKRFYYTILLDSDGTPLETGMGYLSASTTLVREKVLATYSGGTYDDTSATALSLAAGTKRVICSTEAGAMTLNPLNVNTSATTRVVSPMITGSAGSLVVTTNRCYYIPFVIATPRELDAIVFRVSSGSGSTQAKVGIYTAAINGKPGDRIDQSAFQGTGTGASGSKITATLTARRYPPGLYFLAFACDGAPTINAPGTVGQQAPLLGADSTGVQMIGCVYEGLSGGWTDLPSTANSTLTEIALATGSQPTLSMRVV